MEGVVTSIGWKLPAFSGAFGNRGRGGPQGSRRRYRGFAAVSSDLMGIATQALQRYQNAIDTAQTACDNQSTWTQAVFNWVTGNTSTESICSAVEQMKTNYSEYSSRIQDPDATDDQVAQIISFVNKEVDIKDLLATAAATGVWTVTGDALVRAPGTAVGLVAKPAGELLSGVLGNIPWWVWAAGAAYLAFDLGIVGGAARRIRERAA